MKNTSFIVTVLLFVDSLHFVFARLLLPQISPAISAFYVLLIGTVQVGIYGLWTRQLKFAFLRKHGFFFAIIGFLVAASTNINYEAVAYVDAGTASMLAQSATIFGIGLGIIWLGEKLNMKQTIGALIAIIGVVIVSFQTGDYFRIGAILLLIAAFLYSLHGALTKRFSERIDFINFFFFRLVFTTLFLLLFSSLRGAVELPTSTAWAYLFLVGTVDISISRTVYYLSLRRLSLSLHTLILTVSPVVAIIWALALFNTFPSMQQLLGGITVIIGVFIASINKKT